jgi:hypothetical protein
MHYYVSNYYAWIMSQNVGEWWWRVRLVEVEKDLHGRRGLMGC